MPPDFGEFAFLGWQEKFPHGFAGRGKSGEGASKSHLPFNLHTIRPCLTPPISIHFFASCSLYQCSFLEAPPWPPASSINVVLGFIPPNRPNGAFYFLWGIVKCHPCPENGTQGITAAHGGRMPCSSFSALCRSYTKPSQQRNPCLFSVNISLPVFTGACFLSVLFS